MTKGSSFQETRNFTSFILFHYDATFTILGEENAQNSVEDITRWRGIKGSVYSTTRPLTLGIANQTTVSRVLRSDERNRTT